MFSTTKVPANARGATERLIESFFALCHTNKNERKDARNA
jgi:hypothetical protein